MKKSLLVALTVLLILCTSGIANAGIEQFVDVPADHWAYDAIENLAGAGLVKGYAGGIPRGDLCRYDIALIVAKAMARADKADSGSKALINKLAAEFAPELDKLGIQLAKTAPAAQPPAATPAQAAVKPKLNINFEEKIAIVNTSLGFSEGGGYPAGSVASHTAVANRFRVYFNSPCGDDFIFNARLSQLKMNIKRADNTGALTFDRIYFTDTNAFGGRLDVGRMLSYVGKGGFWANGGNSDGVAYATNVGAFTLRLGDGQIPPLPLPGVVPSEYRYGEVTYNISKDTNIGFAQIRQGPDLEMNLIHGKAGVGNGMAVNFEWAKNKAATYHGGTGYWIGLNSRASAADFPPTNYMETPNPMVIHDYIWGISYRHLPAGIAGQFNRGTILSFAPYYQDTNGTYLNAMNDVNALQFDYYCTLKRNLMLWLSYDAVRPINESWRDDIFTSSFTWIF